MEAYFRAVGRWLLFLSNTQTLFQRNMSTTGIRARPTARKIASILGRFQKRKELGLTQSKLAASAGVSQSIIAKIEAGSVDPSYSVVQRLFSALERAGVESPRVGG